MITPSKLMEANVWRFSFSSNLSRFSGERRSYFSARGDTSRFHHNHSHWLCQQCGGQCENWTLSYNICHPQFPENQQLMPLWGHFWPRFVEAEWGVSMSMFKLTLLRYRIDPPTGTLDHLGQLLNKSADITMEMPEASGQGPNVKCLYHGHMGLL